MSRSLSFSRFVVPSRTAARAQVLLRVVIVKDEERFVEKTLRSMISQTLKPVRWIIVEDGSVDGTLRRRTDAQLRLLVPLLPPLALTGAALLISSGTATQAIPRMKAGKSRSTARSTGLSDMPGTLSGPGGEGQVSGKPGP